MKSLETSDWIDFEKGIPGTREDAAAYESHQPGPMTMDEYIAFLKRHGGATYEELRKKEGPKGPPFKLP